MRVYVQSYSELNPSPRETDQWADDPALPVCGMAAYGGCDGFVVERGTTAHPLPICDGHWRWVVDETHRLLGTRTGGGR